MTLTQNIKIRKAVVTDVPVMMQLIQELATFEREPDAVTVSITHFTETGFGSNPVWWAWVAEVPASSNSEAQVVGFALYYIRYSTWRGSCMYLEDLIITESWRGKGLGSMLLDVLIEECRSMKMYGMSWQVLDWNEAAIRFYNKYKVSLDSSWINVQLIM